MSSAVGGDVHIGGSGTPLVLLHGASSSWRAWQRLLPDLEAHYTVFAPTLGGHRGGPPLSVPRRQVVPGIVDVLRRQLDEAGIDTAHVVGNSLGGWVALELARLGRARSVVGLSPAGAWRTPTDLRRIVRLFRIGVRLGEWGAVRRLCEFGWARKIVMRSATEHADRLTTAEVREIFEDMAGCVVLADLLDGASDAGPLAAFSRIDCPVRIVWGEHDRMLPFRRYGRPLLDAVPGAELVRLPGVGHVPMIDDPAGVAHTILEFVDRADREPNTGRKTDG